MKQACLCLTLSIFLTIMAACSGQTTTQEVARGENTTSDTPQESTGYQENETDNATYQVPGFPAFSPAPKQLELVEDRGATLLVRHNMGETEVPKNPQRVYVNTNVEVPVALGFNVVGGWYGSWQPMPPAFEEATRDAEIVDWSEVPNYEFVASLEPDLIFHWDNSGDPEVYELLSEIAPTIRFETDPFVYWREATLDLATVFGLEETANTLLTGYDTIITAECERIHSVIGDETIDLVTVYEDSFHLVGPIWEQAEGFYTPSAYSIWAYRDCQLLPGVEVEELVGVQGSAQLSLETIAELESEHLFVMQSIGQNETLEDILDEPLWQTLPAVQNGNVYLIEQIGANGYYSGIYTLELAASAITGTGGEETEANTGETVAATSDCEDGFRPFAHAAGETCVPENPQRIVTTQDQNALLPLLELDVKPIGSTGLLQEDGTYIFRRVADFDTTGIEFVGDYGEPNLESIAALQPDLIIGPPFQADIYDSLSAIAPTVLIDVHERPLDEALMDFAELVNATDQAEALRAEYKSHVADLLEALGDRREQTTVSIITPGGESGQFYNEAGSQATGTVVQDLDLLRPVPEQGPEPDREYRSLEVLAEHDADVMIIVSYTGEEQDPLFDAFVNSPILNALNVSQAEQVYIIDGLSVVGAGWSKMNTFIDELERILLAPELDVDVVQE